MANTASTQGLLQDKALTKTTQWEECSQTGVGMGGGVGNRVPQLETTNTQHTPARGHQRRTARGGRGTCTSVDDGQSFGTWGEERGGLRPRPPVHDGRNPTQQLTHAQGFAGQRHRAAGCNVPCDPCLWIPPCPRSSSGASARRWTLTWSGRWQGTPVP